MKRHLFVLVLFAFASTAPVLAQQGAARAAVPPADPGAGLALADAGPLLAGAVIGVRAATARERTLSRIRALRAAVPASDVSLANQLSAGLRARDAAVRGEALADVIFYAAYYGDLVDLTGLVPELLLVFERDPEPAFRIMASQAICHLAELGDVDAVRDLARLALKDPSPRVRHLALSAAASWMIAEQVH